MKRGNVLYLDHQANTPTDKSVLQQMLPYFTEQFGNAHAVDHVVGWQSSQAVAVASSKIAGLIGADPDEIIFTSGATEANNLALLGLACHFRGKGRKRILVSAVEHKSVLAAAEAAHRQFGYQIDVVAVDSNGEVRLDHLRSLLDDTVLVVSIMDVNNEIGTVQDTRRLSDLVHSVGAIFHTDAAQAPLARDVRRLADDVDLASLSAHKMYGPPGIGALFVRRHLQSNIEPQIHGGGQQNGLRSGTMPLPLCVGMGAAADLLLTESAVQSRTRLQASRDRLSQKLMVLPWTITVNGQNAPRRHPGNLNVCFHGFSADDILAALQPRLAASTGSACTSGIPAPSHVLKAIGLSGDDAESSIRFSVGHSTTDADVDEAAQLIREALEHISSSREH